MKLLDVELRETERNADEIKTYRLILKRIGDGNLAANTRDKIVNHLSGLNKYGDF